MWNGAISWGYLTYKVSQIKLHKLPLPPLKIGAQISMKKNALLRLPARDHVRPNNYSINRVKFLFEIIRTKNTLLEQFRKISLFIKEEKTGILDNQNGNSRKAKSKSVPKFAFWPLQAKPPMSRPNFESVLPLTPFLGWPMLKIEHFY